MAYLLRLASEDFSHEGVSWRESEIQSRTLTGRSCMSRLINTEFTSARKRQLSQESPALILHHAARNVRRFHARDECIDVVAHQIQLVTMVGVRRMDSDLRRRQSKDQPAVAN